MMADLGIAEIRAEGRRLLADLADARKENDGDRVEDAKEAWVNFTYQHHGVLLADPAPVGLTEEERLHMTNLRGAWRRAAPVYTDLAATDVEWLCTLIDRLSSPSVDPEEKP